MSNMAAILIAAVIAQRVEHLKNPSNKRHIIYYFVCLNACYCKGSTN